jgi:hypothetical protein
VRAVEWQLPAGVDGGGKCFWRAMTGVIVLKALDIQAELALGGMVYRAGPDEWRDVMAFCGPGNVGTFGPHGFLAHYFIVSGSDIVDFSVGDWKVDVDTLPEVRPPGEAPLPPIQWTAPPLPDFFWDDRSNFQPETGPGATPALGRAWYTGFDGSCDDLPFNITDQMKSGARSIAPHIAKAFERFALKERVWAVRNGHTAVRFSQLAKLVDDPSLLAMAKENEHLVVLRGKVELTPARAAEILAEMVARPS